MTNSTALFTWFHMEDQIMDFDRFKNFVGQRLGSTKSKKLDKLLENIESHIHSTNTWERKDAHMDPCFRYYADNRSQKFPGGPRAKTLWLCFPYFSLERTPCPVTQSSRELRVDFVDPVSPGNQYFNISQFWCLITEDRMFTYGRVPMSTLVGPRGPIRLAPSCSNDSGHAKAQDQTPQGYIRVLDRGNRMYLLAAQSCCSWLVWYTPPFVSHRL
ncbi:hypothetical protein IWZ01DRAFT_218679 [Phyllosticta capitalensis]